MKLFYNFNTRLSRNIYKESCSKFGKENVMILRRAYIFFVFKVFFPTLFLVILTFLSTRLVSYVFIEYLLNIEYLLYINIVIILFLFALIWIPIIKKYIDYKMDFIAITPNYVSAYNQTWIFSRSNRVIDTTNIETITIPKTWFIMSVFNYGTIVFLSGVSQASSIDDGAKWNIGFNYVFNPEKTKKKITDILQKNSKNGYFSKENSATWKNEFVHYT